MGDRSCLLNLIPLKDQYLFELQWGQGQLSAIVDYPDRLIKAYQIWRCAYIKFYRELSASNNHLRGKIINQGNLKAQANNQQQLVEGQMRLVGEFEQWLCQERLEPLRRQILTLAQAGSVDLMIATKATELIFLPWESWQLQPERPEQIRICRTMPGLPPLSLKRKRRGKLRLLAIFGYNERLNLAVDRQIMAQLENYVEITYLEPQPPLLVWKQKIAEVLKDPLGWDLLFFAGHSDANGLTGGELSLAPGVSLAMGEIIPYLKHSPGLRLAIFNSCDGVDIARSLLSIGTESVIVMREPIHDRVAQEFLKQLINNLATGYIDIQAALDQARNSLLYDHSLTYTSTYLVPSLFRHPQAELLQLQRQGRSQRLRQWLPSRRQWLVLGIISALSLMPGVSRFLLEERWWWQAVYRDLTQQLPDQSPPVVFVSIDPKSIQQAKIGDPMPMDRAYLAELLDAIAPYQPKVVGIDYLFDRSQPQNDRLLAHSVRKSVSQGVWLVFAAIDTPSGEVVGVNPETNIADPRWSLEGSINSIPSHLRLPPNKVEYNQSCPFAYLLALIWANSGDLSPSLDGDHPLDLQLWQQPRKNSSIARPDLAELGNHWLTTWAAYFGQLWLRPLVDYSIPQQQVYQTIPAWQLLAQSQSIPQDAIVILGPGGYEEAGISRSDNYPNPRARRYWQLRGGESGNSLLVGAEIHAYGVHHFLTGRMVVPVADLWAVLLAAVGAKGLLLWLNHASVPRSRAIAFLILTTVLTGWGSLQLYITSAVLVPWLMPTATLWLYVLIDRKEEKT